MKPYAMMPNSPCMICHQHGDSLKKDKLRRMEDICRRNNIVNTNNKIYYFNWGFHSHCRYGLDCPSLRQFDRECEQIAHLLEPKIAAIAASGSKDYHALLDLCRGDFPAVYNELEAIHHKAGV